MWQICPYLDPRLYAIKYDRIDPSEVQALKDEAQRLSAEKAALEAANVTQTEELKAKSERVDAVEKALSQWKERNAQQIANFRQRLGTFNGEKSQLNASLQEAQAQLKVAQAERDALKASSAATALDSSSQHTAELAKARTELQQQRTERDQLAKALEEARKANTSGETVAAVAAVDTAELDARIASLTQERDALLTEKATWSASASTATGTSDEVKRGLESKIPDLEKSRDTAIFEAKSLKEQLDKVASDVRGLRQQNETFKARLTQEMTARQKLVTEHKAALDAAAQKATNTLESGQVPADTETLVKQHADELRALEERLVAKHQEELKAAATNAASTPADAPADADQTAAIERAVAEKISQLEKQREEELSRATENGRLEGQMKMKVKDAQLVKVQRKVKDLEAQIHEWRTAGIIPAEEAPATTATANAPASSSSAAPAPVATTSAPPTPTSGSAPPHVGRGAPRGGAPGNALPRKPSIAGNGPAVVPPQPGRGRGRGVAIGRGAGMSIRGTAAGAGTGAVAGGVSIIGAAGKRAREDSGSDSLAKRLKPAEGAAPGKPVTIQRNRQQPPSGPS
ncbi:hypothetical protein OF83DRAFT_912321 [Amylostereum chailletii]|nr:hypothetical protein OF83DRAFT_912321 [Amylostereum chailletii]